MSQAPYVYVATGKSRDVQRSAPTGARVAMHYPELGRTIELWTGRTRTLDVAGATRTDEDRRDDPPS